MRLVDSRKFIEALPIFDYNINKYVPFKLWEASENFKNDPSQVELLHQIHTQQELIILKRRQIGVSELTGADTLCQSICIKNFETLVVSIGEREAIIYLERIKKKLQVGLADYLEKYPLIKNTATELHFKNGSKITSLPSSSITGSGYTACRVIIDEAAKIESLKLLKTAISPTLEQTNGQLIIITTAFGLNYFHQLWKQAELKETKMTCFFLSCWADPKFTEERRIQKVASDGESDTNQEYPRTPKEAFLSSGTPRFDREFLEKNYENGILKPLLRGYIGLN
jgi:hypothetical protein